eukprot:CAMPEP_0114626792 /NCGR_PEP_ID=MMETSP0168-20121206/11966_1 /TAXON_ID=95228 ORGANISM="Vannella sp., Strain DIVA3 517/6/12" /NCGR_SAMPLE_ID=MMETSP0168 /ASSEMBLY_ACC=CAM_ASM_000044 /LENGTH=589 /DNA_ID=CAMNT_0001838111 /DNA_START=70 /DNA_END=1835 /DNA_ORIENTATION=-
MVRKGGKFLHSKKTSDKASFSRTSSYVTRGQAIRRLQLSLPQFRKLCILKGVYPREPTKKVKGKDKTYYYTKDILFLANDPILKTFREKKTWRKRVTKAKGRHAPREVVQRIEAQMPVYKLDHIIRERYPTFVDALRELDDALSMIHLFAQMPTVSMVDATRIANCKRLCLELQSYVMHARALRKVFVSIKGTYYQASIQGERVTWIVPFQYTHRMPKEVDVRVMLSFLEFYESLMGFVNYKLFSSQNLHYPPKLDLGKEADGESLFAVILEPTASEAAAGGAAAVEDGEDEEGFEEEATVFKDVGAFQDAEKKANSLFEGMAFFLSREVPRHSLEFVIRSLGGQVSWDGPSAPYGKEDPRITHVVVDRPAAGLAAVGLDKAGKGKKTAALVQPQWVFDSVNAGLLLPVEEYGPDAKLPPHLSPFVDNEKEGYMPERAEEIAAMIAASKPAPEGAEEEESSDEEMADADDSDDDEEEAESGPVDDETRYAQELALERQMAAAKSAELLAGLPQEPTPAERKERQKTRREKKEKAQKQMAAIMIPNKKKRQLYKQIEYSKTAKAEKNQKLLEKREAAASPVKAIAKKTRS